MKCEKCGGKLRVVDVVELNDEIHRCRKCDDCEHTIYTSEIELTSDKDFYEARREKDREYAQLRKLKKMSQTKVGDDGITKGITE